MSLIDELYDSKSAKLIKGLYSSDSESRDLMYASLGRRIMDKSDVFLSSKPLDVLSLLCMTASFTNNKEECQQVAIIVYRGLQYENPLPYIMDDQGFLLAEKTLVSLSFFRSAMEHRTKYSGAPSSDFYRRASKVLFSKNGHQEIADHHENWENFLSEIFV